MVLLPVSQNCKIRESKVKHIIFLRKSEKKLSRLKIDFKCRPRRVVQCACIQPYHVINLNTRTWPHSVGSMFEMNFQTG